MIELSVKGGQRKAKRYLRTKGFEVGRCKLAPQRFSRESAFKAPVGRASLCSVPCTERNHRETRRLFLKDSSNVFWFRDRC